MNSLNECKFNPDLFPSKSEIDSFEEVEVNKYVMVQYTWTCSSCKYNNRMSPMGSSDPDYVTCEACSEKRKAKL